MEKAKKVKMVAESQWAHLLPELLAIICEKSNKTWFSNSRVRAVCKSWENSIPALDNKAVQFSFGNPRLYEYTYSRDVYLSEKTLYCLKPVESSSLDSWFICVEEFEGGVKGGKKVHLVNSLTGMYFDQLPPNFPRKLNLCDFHIQELKKFYHLQEKKRSNMNEKTLFLSDSTNNKIGLAVLHWNGILSFFKLVNEKWNFVRDIDQSIIVKDIANYKGKICAFTGKQTTIMIDSSFKSTFPIDNLSGDNPVESYLVESLEDLFLVELLLPAIKVYKLHEEEKKWIEVTNLGESVLFVSPFWSFSLPYDLLGLGLKNCIVFTRLGRVYVYYMGTRELHDMHPKYASMFWPPPDWLLKL